MLRDNHIKVALGTIEALKPAVELVAPTVVAVLTGMSVGAVVPTLVEIALVGDMVET